MATTTETYDLKIKVGSQGVEKIDAATVKVGRLDTTATKASKSVTSFGRTASAIPQQLKLVAAAVLSVITVLAVLSTGLGAAITTHAQFERSMSNVASVAGATAEELDRLSKAAREQAKTSVFSAREAADAQYYLASAGMSVTEIIDAQRGVMDLAAATQAELAYTAESVASALSQFGLEASEATRVANVYASAISGSQATMQKLTDSMRYAGPIAAQLGQSLEGTTAQLMALYNGGLRGEQAGTALRAAMLRLQDPTKEMAATLAEMNVSLTDGAGQARPFMEIIQELSQKHMTAAQATKIFGQEAAAAMLILAKDVDKVKEYEAAITGTGRAAEMAKQQTDNLWGDWQQFKNTVEDLALDFGDKLNPALRETVQSMTRLLERFGELQKYAGESASFELLGNVFSVLGGVLEFLSKGLLDVTDNLLRLADAFLKLISIGEWIKDPVKHWASIMKALKLSTDEAAMSTKELAAIKKDALLIWDMEYQAAKALKDAQTEQAESAQRVAKEEAELLKKRNAMREDLARKMAEQTMTQEEIEIAALMRERQRWIDLGGDKLAFIDYFMREEMKIRNKYAEQREQQAKREAEKEKQRLAEKVAKFKEAQQRITLITETESEKVQRIYDEQVAELYADYREGLITWAQYLEAKTVLARDAAQEQMDLEDKQRTESLTGWRKYLAQWAESFKDASALIAEGAKNVFSAIGNAFRDLVTDAIEGEFTEITDYLEALGRKILIIWGEILAQMAAQWTLKGIGALLLSLATPSDSSSASGIGSSIGMKIGETLLGKGASYALDALFSSGSSSVIPWVGEAAGGLAGGASGAGLTTGLAGAANPGVYGAMNASLAGTAGAASLAGLGTLAAGAGIGAAAIGIMFGVTYGLGSLFNDDMTTEEAIERTESNLAYAERVLNNPNIRNFSPSLEGTLTNSQRISGLAGYTPEQLQAMYYELGPDAPYTYQGLSTAANLRSITDAMGSAYRSSYRSSGADGTGYSPYTSDQQLLGGYADLISQLGLSSQRQIDVMDSLVGLADQYQSGDLDLNGAGSAEAALSDAMQQSFLDTLYEALNAGEITMEHMREINDVLASFDPSLYQGTYQGGAGSWENPFDLLGLTNDQFLEQLEHETAIEESRLETLDQLRAMLGGLKTSEADWAATMLESIQGLDAQNLSAEELATQLQTQLNPALHITNNLERDLADGMSKVDAVTKARNETIDALLSTTNLAADHEQGLINLLIEHSGNVEQVTADYNRYLEIKGLLAGAHNLEAEEIQALLEEGRALHEQLNLQTTDMGDVTSSIDTLVDSIQDLVNWFSNIPSNITTTVTTVYQSVGSPPSGGGEYHTGGLVTLHSGGSVARAITAQALGNNLITMHGGGLLANEIMAKLKLGEYVIQDSSVNAGTMPWLEYVNEKGEIPGLKASVEMSGGTSPEHGGGGTVIYSPTYNIELKDSVVAADDFVEELEEKISERTIEDLGTLTAAGFTVIDSKGVGDTRRFNNA